MIINALLLNRTDLSIVYRYIETKSNDNKIRDLFFNIRNIVSLNRNITYFAKIIRKEDTFKNRIKLFNIFLVIYFSKYRIKAIKLEDDNYHTDLRKILYNFWKNEYYNAIYFYNTDTNPNITYNDVIDVMKEYLNLKNDANIKDIINTIKNKSNEIYNSIRDNIKKEIDDILNKIKNIPDDDFNKILGILNLIEIKINECENYIKNNDFKNLKENLPELKVLYLEFSFTFNKIIENNLKNFLNFLSIINKFENDFYVYVVSFLVYGVCFYEIHNIKNRKKKKEKLFV